MSNPYVYGTAVAEPEQFFGRVNELYEEQAAASGDTTLADMAQAATQALYAHQPVLDADAAWTDAKALRARARGDWQQRLRTLFVTPVAANRRLSAHQHELRLPPARAEAGSLVNK